MKRAYTVLLLLLLAAGAYSQDQSTGSNPPPIPTNPDSLFGSPSTSSVEGSGGSTGSASNGGGDQTGPSTQSPSSMFQGGMVEDVTKSKAESSATAATSLLKSQGIQFGGSIESTYTAYGFWLGAYPDLSNLASGYTDQMVPVLQGTMFFDARPDQHFRVFGKAKASYPFQVSGGTSSTGVTSALGVPPTQTVTPNINIFELYSDFDYKNKLYFRVGKQVVNWGVGYFFSPADIISVTPIDPQNPTIEREGPVAFKVNMPFAEVDNLYLYLVANQSFATGSAFHLNDVAVAPKAEFVVGDYEFGLGGYYQRNQRPKAMVTATGSIGKIGVFGEAVVSRGADGTLVRQGGAMGYETYTDTTTPYFQGTVGFNYMQSDWHLSLYGQYYYNGQGYADPTLEKEAYILYAGQVAGTLPVSPQLSLQDLQLPARNYGAAVASWSNIKDSNVTLSLFWEGNFTDGSGIVSPSVSYKLFDHASLTAATHIAYGGQSTQFMQTGHMSVSLQASLGTGDF